MFRGRKPVGLIGLPLRFTECDESVCAKDCEKEEESTNHSSSSHQRQEKKASTNEQMTDSRSQQSRARVTGDNRLKGDPSIQGRNKENEFPHIRTKDNLHLKTPTNTSTNYTNPSNDTSNCTFPGVHDNCVTSSNRLAPHKNGHLKITPSSTFPSSNPQSVENVRIRHVTHQSFNHTNGSQVATPAAVSKRLQATEPHSQETQPSQPLESADSSVGLRHCTPIPDSLDATSKPHDPINKQFVPNRKPPLNTAAIRQQQVSQNDSRVRKMSLDSTHGLDSEIVLMKSQGSDRKYKKLKLLGTGGSSKVCRVIHFCFLLCVSSYT